MPKQNHTSLTGWLLHGVSTMSCMQPWLRKTPPPQARYYISFILLQLAVQVPWSQMCDSSFQILLRDSWNSLAKHSGSRCCGSRPQWNTRYKLLYIGDETIWETPTTAAFTAPVFDNGYQKPLKVVCGANPCSALTLWQTLLEDCKLMSRSNEHQRANVQSLWRRQHDWVTLWGQLLDC